MLAPPRNEAPIVAGIPEPVDGVLLKEVKIRGEALQVLEQEPGFFIVLSEFLIMDVLEELFRLGTFADRFPSKNQGPGGPQVQGYLDEARRIAQVSPVPDQYLLCFQG